MLKVQGKQALEGKAGTTDFFDKLAADFLIACRFFAVCKMHVDNPGG